MENLGVCRTTLWRKFLPFFRYWVSPEEINRLFPVNGGFASKNWVLGLDGKWLHKFGVVMIYRDTTSGVNLFWSWQKSESYQNLLENFKGLFSLAEKNLPSGVISDWKGAIVALVSAFFPNKPHQRCLAHLVREAKKLLPAGSPFFFTWILREIAREIITISDPSDYYDWSVKLSVWERNYGFLLKEKTLGKGTKKKWWYTHGNLRRGVKLLTKNQESLFWYLHHPFLPKTNNSLEGVNSQLKGKLAAHRGMKPEQQISFCFWHLAFSRIKNKKDLKILWGRVKKRIPAV